MFGLGASGLAAAAALAAGGADVAAWDDTEASREGARKAGLPVVDLAACDWSKFAALVLAPGVPLTHPEPHWTVRSATRHLVEVIGDVELFCRERHETAPQSPFVAITGTNGKSTTTALISHILRAAGRDVQMGGNIGRAILTLAGPAPDRVHVIEMSSFQIDLTPSLRPSIGVLLNITPDHLDRHGTLEAYAALKGRLIGGADQAVVGIDDALCRDIADTWDEAGTRVTRISARGLADVHWREGQIWRRYVGASVPTAVADLRAIGSLRGEHNGQNACAAYATASSLGVSDAAIADALATFPGLAHRLEEVGRVGRVLFFNDSKATNADSTQKALASFPGAIHWIVGGKAKDGGIGDLRPFFPRIAKAYLIGASSADFASTLAGQVSHEACGTLEQAVVAATRDAQRTSAAEPVVLLSPACASYDQFRSFEQRGDRFRDLVRSLPGFTASFDPQAGA